MILTSHSSLRSLVLLSSLALASWLGLPSGCGTVAMNFPSVMADEDFQKGAASMRYSHEADLVWIHVKETLAHLSSRKPDYNEDTLHAFATVEAGSIQVRVIRLGEDNCLMAVRARQYGVFSEELARSVLDRIHQEIEP
ncbi:hypothetical protein [Planctomycetes bacterium Poly30]